MNQKTEVKISRFEIAKSEREIKRTKLQLDYKMENLDQDNRVAKFEMSKYILSTFEIAKSEFTKVGGSCSDGSNPEGLHFQTLSKTPPPEVTNFEKRCLEGYTEVSNSQAALSQSSHSEVASSEAANSERLRQQSRIETSTSEFSNSEGLCLQSFTETSDSQSTNSQNANSQTAPSDAAVSKTAHSEILPQQSATETSSSERLNPEILRLQNLHSQVLIANVKNLAQKEKALTMQIIDYLSEIARRRAYLPKYTSLFTFLVEELGYCPSTAMLRINAIKAFAAVPEIRKKVLDNKMSLNAVAKTQSFINQQIREDQNKDKAPLTKEEQRELFASIENTPASQIEDTLHERKQELDARKAEAKGEPPPPREMRTQKVTLEIDGELQKMVEELKSLLSHTHPGASLSMLLKQILPNAIEKLKRDRGLVKVKRKAAGLSSMDSGKNRAVPSSLVELAAGTAAPRSSIELAVSTATPHSSIELTASTAVPRSSIELAASTTAPRSSMELGGSTAVPNSSMALGECTEASSSLVELGGSTAAICSSVNLGSSTAAPSSSVKLGECTAAPSSPLKFGASAAIPRSLMKFGVSKSEEDPARRQKKAQTQVQAHKFQSQKATDGSRTQLKTIKRGIPAPIKQLVWNRDQGCCQYSDPKSQKTCGSRHQVQFDHIKPWSIGGEHSSENLRLLCGIHNRHRSRSFGI